MNHLVTELRRQLTDSEVRFDEASRALYATDSSNYRQIPIGIIIPRTVADLVKATAIAHRYDIPLLVRGAGTSLAGQACNIALIIDTSKYLNKIIKIDAEQRFAWVEPGVILDDLRQAAERYQLTFGPDPATHSRCTLGGMIGNNASGVHSIAMGKTVDNIEALEILTYDGLRLWVGKTSESELARLMAIDGRCGEIYRHLKQLRDQYSSLIREKFPKIPRRVSGYNLDELLPENNFHVARALVGTESTCVLILQAQVKLCSSPPHRVLLVLGFPDIYIAGDVTATILPYQPLCIEGLDADMIDDMRKKGKQLAHLKQLPQGRAWLLVEFGGDCLAEAIAKAERLIKALTLTMLDYRLLTDAISQKQIWAIRESGAAATNSVPGERESYPGWEDAAVDPQQLGHYLRDFRRLLDHYNYKSSLYGHFGEGCVHARISFDLHQAEGLRQWRNFLVEATDLVVKYGGSLSGEHGDGQARAELLPQMFGNELVQAFNEFKTIWDPQHRLNPGKIVQPYPIDSDLRLLATDHQTPQWTHFSFYQDQGRFAQAVNRCVGVGQCRRTRGGLMCPSYKATREEQYSTRGRAHLLFEMLQGELLHDGWNHSAIKEALECCLACKGCKQECPVAVDMATYKAEFMAHYYITHRRPLTARVLGKLSPLAHVASQVPSLVNFFTQTPLLRDVLKWVGDLAPQRQIPVFAPQSFVKWFNRRKVAFDTRKPVVILWPDTFNNYFRPQTAIAAVQVLESCGYQVKIPQRRLCCGRPLYDSGQLDQAKYLLQQILEILHEEIAAGIPLVGLEPSCLSVFRDELLNFFPNNTLARQLSQQTFLFSEFLIKVVDWQPSQTLQRTAIVQGHCHHQAVFGMKDEMTLLTRLGIDFTLPESGCCGMAGAFGFNKRHYPLSIKLAENALLPAIRIAPADVLIIANGFSCREQIEQSTSRKTVHIAEVAQQALYVDAGAW